MGEVLFTRESGDYYARKKLRSGKTAMVAFFREMSADRTRVSYYMTFVIVGKRKTMERSDYFDDRLTGDGSLEGLMFAKRALVEFESEVTRDSEIVIVGSDSRRSRVYARYLERLGYVNERRRDGYALVKRVIV